MSTSVQIVPEDAEYLTEEDLLNPDNKIIFVQHSEEITKEKLQENLEHLFEKKHGKDLSFKEIDEPPCYPVAFGDGKIVVTKNFDRYVVAVPRRK